MDHVKATNGRLIKYTQNMDMVVMDDQVEYAEIGARMRKVRLAFSELNQKDWAARHNFTHSRYNNWEIGLRRISVDEAIKLSDLYGLDLDYIYRGKLDGLSDSVLKRL